MTLSNPAQYISGRTVQEQMNSLIDYVDARAAEVATDAIAADVAQVHQDMLDADADATAAAAAAAAAAGTLANVVKKTGEASQSIAGDITVSGTLDATNIGSGSTPVVCGNLTAYGNVSLDDTTLQGNLSGADASALINLSGVGSVLVPTPTSNGEAATKKYVDDADALKISITDINTYAVGLTGNQTIAGQKTRTGQDIYEKSNYGSNTFKHMTADVVNNPGAGERFMGINFVDMNGVSMVNLRAGIASNGKCVLGGTIRNSDGTTKYFTIVSGD